MAWLMSVDGGSNNGCSVSSPLGSGVSDRVTDLGASGPSVLVGFEPPGVERLSLSDIDGLARPAGGLASAGGMLFVFYGR